jgi:uncharacterized RDD family membrane protein YckC
LTNETQPTINNLNYASFSQRFLALLIDLIILSLVGNFWQKLFGNRLYATIISLVNAAYSIVLWVNWNGQTVGKKLLRIKVVRSDRQPIDYRTAILRYLGYIVSAIPLLIGYFWMLWDPKKQTWHDKIAQTAVVKE